VATSFSLFIHCLSYFTKQIPNYCIETDNFVDEVVFELSCGHLLSSIIKEVC